MPDRTPDRRRFLHRATRLGALAAVALPAIATPARAAIEPERRLSLVHTHTGERLLGLAYARAAQYLPESLQALNRFLRDHYSGEVGTMDPALFDLLHAVQRALGRPADLGAYEIISGYRSPATNDRLRRTRGGGVASRSLHMDGRAIDVRLPGVPLAELRDAALALRAGGVGYYPDAQFVHLDTGAVRRW